jgi:hypothetical protein
MTHMHRKMGLVAALACIFLFLPVLSLAQNEVTGVVHFIAKNKAAKDSGVWVDGRYLGYLSELHGYNKVTLIPGPHKVSVRQAGFIPLEQTIQVEPGATVDVAVAMQHDPKAVFSTVTSELKIEVVPDKAGVFIDGAFAGNAHEFGGVGRAMELKPGTHTIKIACPGYQDFEETVDLTPNQKMKIKETLVAGQSSLDAVPNSPEGTAPGTH